MLSLTRDSELANRIRAYQIVLDGDVVGEIHDGQRVRVDVVPGPHALHLKIDWCRSNIVEFEAGDDPIEFACGSNVRGRLWVLLAFVYGTVRRHNALWLTRSNASGVRH